MKKVRRNFFRNCNFSPFMSKSFQIWDHFFPLLFPKDFKNLKSLDIGLWEVGVKRPLNGVRKWDGHTYVHFNLKYCGLVFHPWMFGCRLLTALGAAALGNWVLLGHARVNCLEIWPISYNFWKHFKRFHPNCPAVFFNGSWLYVIDIIDIIRALHSWVFTNKPAAQAAGADPSQSRSTNRQNPTLQ